MKPEHTDKPFISVIMPVYNSEAYLEEAIASILTQSYPHFEFIIIDDGSSDGSAEIIKNHSLLDARIRPLYLSHTGAGGAANAGIAAAMGDIIARMDADDISLPGRFATQIEWMNQSNVDICGACVKTFGYEKRIMWFPESHEAICNEMLFRCALMQPTVMMRADIAKNYPYNEKLFFEDYELWTRLAPVYRLGNVPQILLKYRTHPQQRHIQKSSDVQQELRNYSRDYFGTLFPDASVEEKSAVASIVACTDPIDSLDELKLTGQLLARLVEVNDNCLRNRMTQRWWSACRRGTHLGLGTYRLYKTMAPVLGSRRQRQIILFIACMLQLKPDSRIMSAFIWFKTRTGKIQCN